MIVLQLNFKGNFLFWIVHKVRVVSWIDGKNSVLIFWGKLRYKITFFATFGHKKWKIWDVWSYFDNFLWKDTDKSKVVFEIVCPRRFQNTQTFFLNISFWLFQGRSKSQTFNSKMTVNIGENLECKVCDFERLWNSLNEMFKTKVCVFWNRLGYTILKTTLLTQLVH